MKLNSRFFLTVICITASILSYGQDTDMNPIVVTGNLSAQRSRETGRNISIIRQEDIRNMPANTLDELLKFIPGIEVQQRGPQGAQSDIVIRGGTFQQVLVVIDGTRLNDPLTGHFNSYIPIHPREIDRIEILKGAAILLQKTFSANTWIREVPFRHRCSRGNLVCLTHQCMHVFREKQVICR